MERAREAGLEIVVTFVENARACVCVCVYICVACLSRLLWALLLFFRVYLTPKPGECCTFVFRSSVTHVPQFLTFV